MTPKNESLLAVAIRALLDDAKIGADIPSNPRLDQVASALERYVPEVLATAFDAWRNESLDGVYPSSAYCRKSARVELEMGGACCVMSTQTFAPLWLRVSIEAREDRVCACEVKLGARGDGHLGLQQVAAGSREAKRLQVLSQEQAAHIEWEYVAASVRATL